MIEAGIAGAEIVERNTHADIAKRLKHRLGLFNLLHHGSFGNLEHQPLRRKAKFGEQWPRILLRQPGIGESAVARD